MDGSFQSLEALPLEHLQIVFVASSSCSEDDTPAATPTTPQKTSCLANGNVRPAQPKVRDVKAKTRVGKTGLNKRLSTDKERTKKTEREEEEEVLDGLADGCPLRRVISIEEDHLPHLLQGGPPPFTCQLSEEKVVSEDDSSLKDAATSVKKTHLIKRTHPPRGQPVGKETPSVNYQL